MLTGCVRDPGQYDQPITVQQLSGSADAHGHIDNTAGGNWSTLATGYAAVKTRTGREYFRAEQVVSDVSHVWVVPYTAVMATVTPAMRLKHGANIHEILSVVNVDESNSEVEIATRRATT